MNGLVLFISSGMVGLVRMLAAKRADHFGRGRLCLFISLSGVVTYGSKSKTAQYKAMVELYPPPVQVMCREENSFLQSRHFSLWTSSFER